MSGIHLLHDHATSAARGLLTIPAGATGLRGSAWQAKIFRTLLRELPAEVDIVLAGHQSTLDTVATWPEARARSLDVIAIPSEIEFTPWCQDHFVAAQHRPSGDIVFLLPKSPSRRGDMRIAELIAEHMKVERFQTPATFEGGNILVGDQFILIGRDTIGDENTISLSAFFAGMGETRPIHTIGTPPANTRRVGIWSENADLGVEERHGFASAGQQIFHLDAFVSPAGTAPDGRPRVLVGDPRAAAALAANHPLISAEEILSEELDAIATLLDNKHDFQVIRNPLPVVAVDETGFACWLRRSVRERFAGVDGLAEVMATIEARGLERMPVRRWCLATQNSAIVFDHLSSGPAMLLPSYAQGRFQFLQACEERNAALWSGLGYRVTEIPGFSGYLTTNGSAHCLFKSLPQPFAG